MDAIARYNRGNTRVRLQPAGLCLRYDFYLRENVMIKKRHSRAEIAAKLAQATDLASRGELQSDIARTLGISVMTLHRWRKSSPHVASAATNEITRFEHELGQGSTRLQELQLENSRLRRLVTDLLLEKMKLEEGKAGKFSASRLAVSDSVLIRRG